MRRTLALLLLLVWAVACSKPTARVSARGLPAGDAVWFEDGVGGDADKVEETLIRGGIATVFLPGARVSRESGQWHTQQLPPPGRPFARASSILVVAADSSFGDALGRREAIPALSDTVSLAIQGLLRDTARYGSVSGVHLDIPFSDSSAEGYGALLSSVRKHLPQNVLLSISLRRAPSTPDEKLKVKFLTVDGVVAFLFGEGNAADPLATDTLEIPWWAGYSPAARGTWQDASGENRGALPEWALARLSDDPRVEFLQGVSLQEESIQTLLFRPRTAISLGEGLSFGAGDRLSYRQPLLSDMVFHLRGDLSGRRFARGRVIALPGKSESERLLTLTALVDLLAAKPAKPDLHVNVESGKGFVLVSAENLSAHASVVSHTSNWVEVQIPTGGIRDVQIGGFDRFELYASDHRPVTMALATAVRFYETLISPQEKIEPARVLLRRPAAKDCCQTRFHVLAASGEEVASDAPAPAK